MRVRIYGYHHLSMGGKHLRRWLGIKRLYQASRFRGRATDFVVNWGSSSVPPNLERVRWFNHPNVVAVAIDKLAAFTKLQEHGVTTPQWTTSQKKAQEWVDAGNVVVCRKLTRAKAGKGIGLVGREIEDGDHTGVVPKCPLYTRYLPKKAEYRVHVVDGQVVDIQEKKRSTTDERWDGEQRIRNKKHGWIYARTGIDAPRDVSSTAIAAVEALGLDYGAVDIGWTANKKIAAVYEVNTAPGLHGTTLRLVGSAINVWMDSAGVRWTRTRASRGYRESIT